MRMSAAAMANLSAFAGHTLDAGRFTLTREVTTDRSYGASPASLMTRVIDGRLKPLSGAEVPAEFATDRRLIARLAFSVGETILRGDKVLDAVTGDTYEVLESTGLTYATSPLQFAVVARVDGAQ